MRDDPADDVRAGSPDARRPLTLEPEAPMQSETTTEQELRTEQGTACGKCATPGCPQCFPHPAAPAAGSAAEGGATDADHYWLAAALRGEPMRGELRVARTLGQTDGVFHVERMDGRCFCVSAVPIPDLTRSHTARCERAALRAAAAPEETEVRKSAPQEPSGIPTPANDCERSGWNKALEWAAGWIDAGYPTLGDRADPRALAMSLRAGRKPLRWNVEIAYIGVGSDDTGPCTHERQVEAVDEATACEIAEAWLVADREVIRIDDVRAARSAPRAPEADRAAVEDEEPDAPYMPRWNGCVWVCEQGHAHDYADGVACNKAAAAEVSRG